MPAQQVGIQNDTTKTVVNISNVMQRQADLPRIPVKIQDQTYLALLDSGAAATLISDSVYANLINPPSLSASHIQLQSVTGNNLEVRGSSKLRLSIGNQNFEQQLSVIKGMPYEVILGIDFIRDSRMVLNVAENVVEVGGQKLGIGPNYHQYNGPRSVTISGAITIPAKHECIASVQTHAIGKGERYVEFQAEEGELAEDVAKLIIHSDLGLVGPQGLMGVRLHNPTKEAITLPIGRTIGTATVVEGMVASIEFTETSLDEEAQGSVPESPKATPSSEERWVSKAKFLEQFNLEHLSQPTRRQLEDLLWTHEAIFAAHEYDLGEGIAISSFVIKLKPDADPVYCRPYPMSEHQTEELKRQLQQMLEHGLIRPAYEGFRSPCLLVKKAGATSSMDQWRLCHSYVKLNSITETLSYPLPNMQRLLEGLGKNKGCISSMDMSKSFYQLRIQKQCQKYASFTTVFGDFTPNRLVMGLKNASACLQRVVDTVYAPVLATGCVFAYLDDLICCTPDAQAHLNVLQKVFSLAKKHGLKYKPSKTKLLCESVRLLGHVISPEGIQVDDSKTRSISNIAEPSNKTEVRRFLGLANFYKRFVPNFAKLALPLINLLKKNVPFAFTKECKEAFEGLKRMLTESPVLRFPDFSGNYPFEVFTDASDRAVAGALHQTFEDGSHPVAFASRVLTPAELPLPIISKESLAVTFALCEKFFYYLHGRHFTLYTDYSALRYLLKSAREPKGSSRLVRDAMMLLDYDFDIHHKMGKDMPHVDGLSRLKWKDMIKETCPKVDIDLDSKHYPACAVTEMGLKTITPKELQERQMTDEALKKIVNELETETENGPRKHKRFTKTKAGVLIHQRQSDPEVWDTVVPSTLRQTVLKEVHDSPFSGHMGGKKMYSKLRGLKLWWSGMLKDAENYLQKCSKCIAKNKGYRGRAPIQDVYQSQYPFQKVSIDFMTGLPATVQGNSVLLTVVCCFSRYVELIPLPNRSAKQVAKAMRDRVFLRHGMCNVVSDNGAEFLSCIMQELYQLLDVRAQTCTAYHPQSQGVVERSHAVVANILAKYVSQGHEHWDEFVSACQFAMTHQCMTQLDTPHIIW